MASNLDTPSSTVMPAERASASMRLAAAVFSPALVVLSWRARTFAKVVRPAVMRCTLSRSNWHGLALVTC